MPGGFEDAHLLYATGWQPSELDAMPIDRLELYLLYKNVRHVAEHGGEFDP